MHGLCELLRADVVVEDKVIEGVMHSAQVYLMFGYARLRLFAVSFFTSWDFVLSHLDAESCLTHSLVTSHADDLIRNYMQLLQGQRLHFRPWEPADDPTLVFLLALVDLILDEINHDVIIDYIGSAVSLKFKYLPNFIAC